MQVTYIIMIVKIQSINQNVNNCQLVSHISTFYDWFQVEIDSNNPHCNYQVRPHLSPWFSAACVFALVHRNHFCHLYQQNKSF